MKYLIGSFFFTGISFYCCSQTVVNSKVKEISIDTSLVEFRMDTIFQYDKSFVLDNYFNELLDSLNKSKIPTFFIDECLDELTIGYCRVSSHETISLRFDLIKRLKKEDVEKILLLSDSNQLKKICNMEFSPELPFNKKSTYSLLIKQLK
jgi:hypothetical protein